jgi:uncharacterized coiled-coil DUF342 family protein
MELSMLSNEEIVDLVRKSESTTAIELELAERLQEAGHEMATMTVQRAHMMANMDRAHELLAETRRTLKELRETKRQIDAKLEEVRGPDS